MITNSEGKRRAAAAAVGLSFLTGFGEVQFMASYAVLDISVVVKKRRYWQKIIIHHLLIHSSQVSDWARPEFIKQLERFKSRPTNKGTQVTPGLQQRKHLQSPSSQLLGQLLGTLMHADQGQAAAEETHASASPSNKQKRRQQEQLLDSVAYNALLEVEEDEEADHGTLPPFSSAKSMKKRRLQNDVAVEQSHAVVGHLAKVGRGKQGQNKFAKRQMHQGTTLALSDSFLPVITAAEHDLFWRLLPQHITGTGKPRWKAMVQAWNLAAAAQSSANTAAAADVITYKTPHQLKKHAALMTAQQRHKITVYMNPQLIVNNNYVASDGSQAKMQMMFVSKRVGAAGSSSFVGVRRPD